MKNPAPVPRVYHKTGGVRFVGFVLAAFGAWMLNSSLSDPIHWRGLPPSYWRFSSSVILLWGIAATISTYSARFKVAVDFIEIGNVFRKKKLSLDAIRGPDTTIPAPVGSSAAIRKRENLIFRRPCINISMLAVTLLTGLTRVDAKKWWRRANLSQKKTSRLQRKYDSLE
jgi:hypothetical protein